jgi:hypothetical protein
VKDPEVGSTAAVAQTQFAIEDEISSDSGEGLGQIW